MNTSEKGVMHEATSTDNGASWSVTLSLPADTPPLHGLRAAKDGSLLTIPNDYTKTTLTRLSSDLTTAKILSTQPAYSVIEQADGTFLVGAEILPGQGVRKIARK
ncbi:MAG: sialidase family protein [Candidatus Kapabacteria bacterium]|nr:sialidase family protein [Candidatus Kapabacteria bacterium]